MIKTLLGTELPIIQAPMAGVQDARLAIAVSNAGGLGSVPAGMLDAAGLRRELEAIRAGATRPFNVNFFCHTPPAPDPAREAAWRARLAPYYAELGADLTVVSAGPMRAPFDDAAANVLADFEPPIVSFHFGLPSAELLARVRRWGAKIVSSATTVDEARWLEARGVDAIIAQGVEAGGHRGMFLTDDVATQLPTLELVARIRAVTKVPVIAAGGIADAEGVAAALAIGAVAVQVGSAYLMAPEATTSEVHRRALMSEQARDTAITNVITGRPARGIVNRVMRELGAICPDVPAYPTASTSLAPLRAAAERRGLGDFSALWAGTNAYRATPVSAADVTRELARGVVRR